MSSIEVWSFEFVFIPFRISMPQFLAIVLLATVPDAIIIISASINSLSAINPLTLSSPAIVIIDLSVIRVTPFPHIFNN